MITHFDQSELKETFLDKDAAKKYFDELIDSRYDEAAIAEEASSDKDFSGDVYRTMGILHHIISDSNLDVIHKNSESPIETIFLSALHFGSLIYACLYHGPPTLSFVSPTQSASKAAYHSRKYWVELGEARRAFTQMYGTSNLGAFVDFAVAHGHIKESRRDIAYMQISLYQDMDLGGIYQLMPQARFPNIKVSGRSVRADAFIWKPTNNHFKLILECDGYKYHSSKEKFANDRVRDRVFKAKGYDVFRFAGAEINQHPIEVSAEVIRFLYQQEEHEISDQDEEQ